MDRFSDGAERRSRHFFAYHLPFTGGGVVR